MRKKTNILDSPLAKLVGKNQYRQVQNGVEVIIGGDRPDLVQPEFHAQKWNNECWLKVRHGDCDRQKIGDKPTEKTEGGKKTVELPVSSEKRTHKIREGSTKWDVQYEDESALPKDLVEVFNLDFPEGLSWYHQPELTAEEVAEGCHRPENIVNSYAGYFSASGRYFDKDGGEIVNYETGKFAHLYRPEMVDANGDRAWATQEIVADELRITLPADWLATATYPVTLDPTFGFSGEGATQHFTSTDYLYAFGQFSPASDGTLASVSAFFSLGNDLDITLGVYSDTAGEPDALLDAVERSLTYVDPTKSWYDFTLSAALTGGSDYWFTKNNNTTYTYFVYDSVAGYEGGYRSLAYSAGVLPDPWGARSPLPNRKYSIYGTYTEGGGAAFSAPALSVQPVIAPPAMSGSQSGVFAAPSVSCQPTVSPGMLVGAGSGAFTAPQISVQPTIAPPVLSGSQTGTFSAPSVSSQPIVSAGTLVGQEGGTFAAPSISVQAAVVAGVTTGSMDGVFSAPSLSVQPVLQAGELSAGSIGDFSLPNIYLTPAIVAGVLSGDQAGSFLCPSLSVQPETAPGTLSGAMDGLFTAPPISIQPGIAAGDLSSSLYIPGVVIKTFFAPSRRLDFSVATRVTQFRAGAR